MLYHCVACHKYWHKHDTSAFVMDVLCEEHKHLKNLLPVKRHPRPPKKYDHYDRSPVPDQPSNKSPFLRTAAA